ncbi:RING finger protein 141-like [Ornithodoros turicata]
MGQPLSSADHVSRQAWKEIATLTFQDFIAKIEELNEICRSQPRQRRLVFKACNVTDTPVLWKSTVQVRCMRVSTTVPPAVQSYRLLSLREFLQSYHMIKAYHSAAAASQHETDGSEKSFSSLFDSLQDNLEECCVCMERKPQVTLPCTHSYCLFCIEQWNVSNTTCPLCREEFNTTDETWVMSEAPASEEVLSEMEKALVEISTKHSSDNAS